MWCQHAARCWQVLLDKQLPPGIQLLSSDRPPGAVPLQQNVLLVTAMRRVCLQRQPQAGSSQPGRRQRQARGGKGTRGAAFYMSGDENGASLNGQLTTLFSGVYRSLCFKLRRIAPAVILGLRSHVSLPGPDELEVMVSGIVVSLFCCRGLNTAFWVHEEKNFHDSNPMLVLLLVPFLSTMT